MLLILVPALGCDGSSSSPTSPAGPFRLTFSLDASFQSPHGDQRINLALVRTSDGSVVASGNATVQANFVPPYRFSADNVLQRGVPYEIHYWIDSNFGGGTEGVCDPRDIDHQWSVELPFPTSDVDITVSHQPELTEDVCDTFD